MNIFKGLVPLLFVSISLISCKSNQKFLFNEANWVVEQQPDGKVEFVNNSMEITDAKGCTVWYKNKINAPVSIEYEVIVIDANGTYDRVSDLNCFWMANDPKSPSNFFKNSKTRQGKFPNYHELTQYYVGYGGHNNTKTRFRRYDGNFERPLLPEHDLSDKKFMIVPNTKIKISLKVQNNKVTYSRNNEVIFEIDDPNPYVSGYFGIRTVNNHMIVKNLKIIEL